MQKIKIKKILLNFKNCFVFCLILVTSTIFTITALKIDSYLLFNYLLLTLSSFLTVYLSYHSLKKKQLGFTNFLLSILFYLGFFLKFSFHSYTGIRFREPVGFFDFSFQSINDILFISSLGFLPLIFNTILMKRINIKAFKEKTTVHNNYLSPILFIAVVTILAFLNLKYNILLFALAPSINLPFSGNAVYFLLLTRLCIFAFTLICFNEVNFKNILLGGIIASISSIGVLSRMGTVTYAFYIFSITIVFFQNLNFLQSLKKTLVSLIILVSLSFLVVVASSGLRVVFISNFQKLNSPIKETKSTENKDELNKPELTHLGTNESYKKQSIEFSDIKKSSSFSLNERLNTFSELALQRWIGIEGVMTVYSIKNKSFSLLKDAFCEKPYKGNSFYNKHAKPMVGANSTAELSTSVPGPVAFFYYSGSLVFLFIGLSLLILLFNLLEILYFKLTLNIFTTALLSTFIAFDFFQFGISPLSFFKYLFFTFSTFLFLEKLNKLISASTT